MRRAESPVCGEGDEVRRVDALGDLGGGLGDHAAAGLGLPVERGHLRQPVVLGGRDDPRHRLDRLDRVLADAGLAGEHHRVGAVEDGVGDVGGLGAGRPRARDHRLEHLGRDDDRLGVAAGLVDRRASARAARPRAGSSTPRSPRATMKPSKASTISSRLSTACGFSILAMTGSVHALLVHDLVHVVDVGGGAHEGQRDEVDRRSAAPSAGRPCPSPTAPGTLTATPGRLMPLWLETVPPTIDRGGDVGAVDLDRPGAATLPSSIRIGSPAVTSPGSPLYVVPQIVASPGDVARW